MEEHEHTWELLLVSDHQIDPNIAHYRCVVCGALQLRATDRKGVGGLHPADKIPKATESMTGRPLMPLTGSWGGADNE